MSIISEGAKCPLCGKSEYECNCIIELLNNQIEPDPEASEILEDNLWDLV